MGTAVFAGRTFRIDPDTISWSFKSKTADWPTLGGKVVQVFGTKISDMTVNGSFGVGGWQQQLEFLQQMKDIGSEQAKRGRTPRSLAPPFHFTYPPRNWDFMVYLKSYTSPDGPRAVVQSPANFSPKWRLTFFIVEDNSGLRRVAQDVYIARLAKGIGWQQTIFNGPMSLDEVTQVVRPGDVGTGGTPGINPGSRGSSGGVHRGVGNQTTDVEQWRGLVASYFPQNTEQMLCIMKFESGGNPNALNQAGSSARGLFQIMASVWADTLGLSSWNDLYDPLTNVKAARVVYDRQGYPAWPNTAAKCGLI
jgi:hypothetical protein